MTPNPNPSPGCICGKRFTMCDDGHSIDCPASNQFEQWQKMATAVPNVEVSQTLPAPGEVDSRFWQQAIGNEIARQCGIGAGTCGNADDGSGLFEVDASLDLNGFAAAMKEASLATVAAANDEEVAHEVLD